MAPRPQGRGRAPGSRLRPALDEPAGQNHRPGAEEQDQALRTLFEEASRVPMPTPAEQASLLRRADEGDEWARDTLLQSKLATVGRMAAARAARGLPFGDLVQEGSIGLMGAIDYFRASGRDSFDAFAEEQIGAQMDAALSNEAAAVRETGQLAEAAHQYESAELGLARELGRAPTEAELATKLEWTSEHTAEIREMVDEARRAHHEELLRYLDEAAAEEGDKEDEDE